MDLDEEPPPLLVAADGTDAVDQNLSSELDDTKITKVPISIITGRMHSPSLVHVYIQKAI